MDPLEAIGAVIGVLTFAGTVFGAVKAYGALQQTVKDQGGEIDALSIRVDKAEVHAEQTGRLADAVETMGEKFATEIKHLSQVWDLNHAHTRGELSDIKEQLKRKP